MNIFVTDVFVLTMHAIITSKQFTFFQQTFFNDLIHKTIISLFAAGVDLIGYYKLSNAIFSDFFSIGNMT